MKTVRCAIYTRKSNEEGLEQAFNSLDAQREAGLDYIRSQKHEGWIAVKEEYDDGGYSGGTMKRPALERLLGDIERGRIDVVVVYKVDRLSRSLGDFARMMQVFDERKVSFVSVTQQFNTTTSMGRLTLNMLLSFAQFEREIAGERIRDKIAATKKQGYWVCGQPPLGYRLQHEGEPRGLYIIPEQAELVREIFKRFAESGSFVATAQALNAQGHTTKRWQSSTGRWHGGKPFSQKSVHSILTNPVYIGKVTHTRGGVVEVFDGRHEPIVERTVWDQAKGLIETRDHASLHRWSRPHLLTGKLRTGDGFAMSPSSVHRPLTKRGATGQKRLVRYYVSQKAIKQGFRSCSLKAINASHLDDIVRGVVLAHVDHGSLGNQPAEIRDAWIRDIIDGCTLAPDRLVVRLVADRLTALRDHEFGPPTTEPNPPIISGYIPTIMDRGEFLELLLRIQIKKLDGRRVLLAPDGAELVMPSMPQPKGHIVEAIGLAYRLHDELIRTGLSIRDYVRGRGISRSKILRLLPLTQLSPDILRHAFAGTLARSVTLDDLLRAAAHLDWEHQAKYLHITHADPAAEAEMEHQRGR